MTQINRTVYSGDKQITAQTVDVFNDFLWVAFAQNSSGNCLIEKQAPFNPLQTYFSLEKSVTEVISMDLDSTNLYVAYDDATLLGEIISKSTPISINTSISKGVFIESPVDVKINGSDLWYLLPGEISGSNAKLLRYNTSGVFQQEVDLVKSGQVVNFARTMSIDSNGDIWIGTYTNPATIIRVYDTGGDVYDFDITEII